MCVCGGGGGGMCVWTRARKSVNICVCQVTHLSEFTHIQSTCVCARAFRRLCECESVCVSVCVICSLFCMTKYIYVEMYYATDFCASIYAFHAFL